jgi:signal transduction histidine kinase
MAPPPLIPHEPPFLEETSRADGSDRVNVLVVDDQTSNLEALEALLGPSDCTLVRARSADEALLALLDREFAAIVLDVMMPGMGGLELAEMIKQRRRTRDVPILFLTAHMLDEGDVLRGYGVGAVDYLIKPIRSEVLRSKIAVFIDLFRKTRAVHRANDALKREVAARERTEEALREANQQLERRVLERTDALRRADRRKDEFLASLAHELRNPLWPIRTAVEVMKSSANPEDAERARAIIVRQVDQMTRLIDDLLDVSRITSDKLMLRIDRVELSSVVATAVETSRPAIAERQHRLTIQVPAEPVVLYADPARIAQVIANLLTNAAKYTAPGGDIRLSAEVTDDGLTIETADNGMGIDAAMLPRIFDLFVQGDLAFGRMSGGLGIGLTLARRLVEMHGGTLTAASDGPGRGSVFSVRLPMLQKGDSGHAPDAPRALARLDPHRILVVDDNQDAAIMLAALLGTWGQTVAVVHDGMSAIEAGKAFKPNVVLLDLGLPLLDGYETAVQLRATPWGKRALVVAVTGWGRETDIERSRAAGIDHHLVKPVLPEALHALLMNSRRRRD